MRNGLNWIGHKCDLLRCSWRSTEAPFVLWLGPANKFTRFFWPEEAIYPSTRLFLWPYGLRLHAWLISILFACHLYLFGHQSAALCSIIIIVFITPFLLFYIFRVPILQDAFNTYEPSISENSDATAIILDSISSFMPRSKANSHLCWRNCCCCTALFNCLPWFPHHRSLAWHRGSSTEIFIAAAYLEFFQDAPRSGPIPSGFIRWIIYQCWPVWSSYIVLMSLTLFIRVCELLPITILGLIWFLFSCLFLISSFFTTKRWISFHEADMIKLFPWMKAKSAILYSNYIPLQIQSIKIGISIILTLFASIFMISIRVLYHQ